MKKKLLSLALVLCMSLSLLPGAALAAGAGAPPPDNARAFNGHSYLLIEGEMTWTQARDYSASVGGYLACITSPEEQEFIFTLIKEGTREFYWIGATDEAEEGVWTWVSGEPFTYSNWASRQPDNNYRSSIESYLGVARVDTDWARAGKWNDFTNTGSEPGPSGLIVEWDQGRPVTMDIPADASVYNGHSYLRVEEGMTWKQAKAYCQARGGYLACVTSVGEQSFIDRLLNGGEMSYYWLGASDEAEEGTWTWLSGEKFDYSNWGNRQPDNNYSGGEDYMGIARLGKDWADPGEWNDFTDTGSVSGLGGFICEWPAVRTNFGSEASGWASPEMEKAYELGLIPETLVGADLTQNITRLEFAAVSVKTYEALTGVKLIPAVVDPFTDCGDPEMLKAYAAGITAGTSETTFTPDGLLDRQEAATMLTRVFKRVTMPGWTLDTDGQYPLPFTMPEPFADDGDISGWARESVYFMASNGIIKGLSGSRFAPRNVTSAQEAQGYANATREQALAIAVRMVESLG